MYKESIILQQKNINNNYSWWYYIDSNKFMKSIYYLYNQRLVFSKKLQLIMITVNNSTNFKSNKIVTWVNYIVMLDKCIFMQNYQTFVWLKHFIFIFYIGVVTRYNKNKWSIFFNLRDQNGQSLKITALWLKLDFGGELLLITYK